MGAPDKLPELLEQAGQRPLTEVELKILAEALRKEEPWLEWAGKRETPSFAVDPVALHIHERVSAQAILRVAAREEVQRELFADPQQQYHEAVQFYQHDIDWTNRLILGDSLQVMASLAKREDLAGKVQMMYIDPPYGIKFASNFQPEIGNRDVKDKDQDLSREPETVKAYRDTWRLGIHSYLSYLRDRLTIAKELLTNSGSLFVQISDENLNRVRDLLDEVFGSENFCSVVTVWKTSSATASLLAATSDYLLWYAKSKAQVKYIQLFTEKDPNDKSSGGSEYKMLALPTGEYKKASKATANELKTGSLFRPSPTTSQSGTDATRVSIRAFGQEFVPGPGGWKTNADGFFRLNAADRLIPRDKSISYVRYLEDFRVTPISNLWADARWGFDAGEKRYVVETNPKVVERCLLMTTDPGDLVLDPTCGSGTTAYVAERWARRWITIDTSRVALAIARQRLLTSRFDLFRCRPLENHDLRRNANGTWLIDPTKEVQGRCTLKCEEVPHITLKGIAQNTNLDPIFAKHEPVLIEKLGICNAALLRVNDDIHRRLAAKLATKQKVEGKKSITDADRRRWELPKKWKHWQVPFDTDEDWPDELQTAVIDYRKAWRAKMDDVDACIHANAEQEELVDQPIKVPGIVRVSGPFTVEAVQPPELSMGNITATFDGEGMFEGEPEELEGTFEVRVVEPRGDIEVRNVEAYLDQMIRLLRTDGVRFPNNKQMRFTRLEPLVGTDSGLHAEGRWVPQGETDSDPDGRASACVGFGPQYGPVTAKQVEQLIRDASRRGYDDLVVAGFSFDGPAQAVIEEAQRKDLRIHMANIRPDVNPGMAGLLKEQPGSQLFTVFGQPRTSLDGPDVEGNYTITMEGVDIYNPVDNSITPTGADKVAAWFIDSDYDGWTFCITQAFFPDRSAWDKLSRALNGPGGVIDEDRFAALSGTVSLPFPAGQHKTVAVKVIDPRGNEVMKVHKIS